MEISVDLEEAENFVTSKNFNNFVLNNTTDFGTAAFIVQSLLSAITEAEESMEEI